MRVPGATIRVWGTKPLGVRLITVVAFEAGAPVPAGATLDIAGVPPVAGAPMGSMDFRFE